MRPLFRESVARFKHGGKNRRRALRGAHAHDVTHRVPMRRIVACGQAFATVFPLCRDTDRWHESCSIYVGERTGWTAARDRGSIDCKESRPVTSSLRDFVVWWRQRDRAGPRQTYTRFVISLSFIDLRKLRDLRVRAATVLALFVCTIALTLVAPLVHADPHAGHAAAIASGTAMPAEHDCDQVDPGFDPTSQPIDHNAHCPLCLPVAAPPAFQIPEFEPVRPVVAPCKTLQATRIPALVAAPLPARGPPLLS